MYGLIDLKDIIPEAMDAYYMKKDSNTIYYRLKDKFLPIESFRKYYGFKTGVSTATKKIKISNKELHDAGILKQCVIEETRDVLYVSKIGEIKSKALWYLEAKKFYDSFEYQVVMPVNWFDRWTRVLGLELYEE